MTLDKPEMRGTVTFTTERKPLFDFGEIIKELKAQVKELEAYKADIENATKMAMDEQCSLDQQHCTCVPLLRQKVKELREKAQKLTDSIEPACTCSKGYTDRGLQDPSCEYCDLQPALDNLKQVLEGDKR